MAALSAFSIEITVGTDGVRSVRVLGKDWNQSSDAHSLLQRLSPLIQKLDVEAKNGLGAAGTEDPGSIQ